MASKYLSTLLTVGCWNIDGLYEKVNGVDLYKLDDEAFKDALRKHDILCIQETHVSTDKVIEKMEDYVLVPHCREISANKRYFGGMLIIIRKALQKGVKINKNKDKDLLEVTLKKSFFGLQRDVQILFTYASPITSCYTKSRTENIIDKIEKIVTIGNDNYEHSIIMGDLNGRTNVKDDFVRDSGDKHSPINNPTYVKDQVLERGNMDKTPVDEQGKKVLEICKQASYRILNGRSRGDRVGRLTRYPKTLRENPSAIDYALCRVELLKQIHSFSVAPFTGLSDHCCISVCIKVNIPSLSIVIPDADNTIHHIKAKYRFDEKLIDKFEAGILQHEKLQKLRATLSADTYDIQGKMDDTIKDINHILLTSAEKTFFSQKGKRNTKKEKPKKKWFNNKCKAEKTRLRSICKQLSKDPFNKNIRDKYVKARAKYKRECRIAEREQRNFLTNKLIQITEGDPKKFWTLVGEMNRWGKGKIDPSVNIEPSEWKKHFQNLFNDNTINQNNSDIKAYIQTFDPLLDGQVTKEELKDAISKMKMGKAVGPDHILGEYIKSFWRVADDILLRVINLIFTNHIYPSTWTESFLKPIYKKLDVKNTGNYRGLAIGSAFGKLFSFILLNRLNAYIENKQLISPHQIGFMKGSRTSDHVFLLKTAIDKIVKKNGKQLYAAFIDFKKAYDTVDRRVMFERLKSLGINGIFLRNLEAMYLNTEYLIRYGDGFLDPIASNVGLKQGCPLSPMLFNLYIDDICSIFDNSCDPININGKEINHFLYADDLVILSSSDTGLQIGLDRLYDFAKGKHLTVSIDKSKTIVFNKTGKLLRREFSIGGSNLEPVRTFCYLGYEISAGGGQTIRHWKCYVIKELKQCIHYYVHQLGLIYLLRP